MFILAILRFFVYFPLPAQTVKVIIPEFPSEVGQSNWVYCAARRHASSPFERTTPCSPNIHLGALQRQSSPSCVFKISLERRSHVSYSALAKGNQRQPLYFFHVNIMWFFQNVDFAFSFRRQLGAAQLMRPTLDHEAS